VLCELYHLQLVVKQFRLFEVLRIHKLIVSRGSVPFFLSKALEKPARIPLKFVEDLFLDLYQLGQAMRLATA
jgi:hypothetical protein